MDLLLAGDGWVLFICIDGTIQTIHTSLNENVLSNYGALRKKGALFDLDRLVYVDFRDDLDNVVILDHKPTAQDYSEFSGIDCEVLEFASRFI